MSGYSSFGQLDEVSFPQSNHLLACLLNKNEFWRCFPPFRQDQSCNHLCKRRGTRESRIVKHNEQTLSRPSAC